MNLESFRDYCLMKSGVTEELPFDSDTLVFKVAGKMFALTDLEQTFAIALKCNPEYSIELQERFENISPAYHMNKKHWIGVNNAEQFDEILLKKLIDNSYSLVVLGLSKEKRDKIK